jgi:predicted phage gp36 major capsid-like protein
MFNRSSPGKIVIRKIAARGMACWNFANSELLPSRDVGLLSMCSIVLSMLLLPLLVLGALALALSGHLHTPDVAIAHAPAMVAFAGLTADAEVKKIVDDIKTAFEAFKDANDERIKQIEAKGTADAALVNKVEKANKDITDLQAKLKDVETAQARVLPAAGSSEAAEKEQKAAREFQAMLQGVRPDEVEASAINIDHYREYKSAYAAMLRRGDKAIPADVQNSLSVGSNPEGGYWVPPDTSGRIVEFIYQTSPLREFAQVDSTQSDTYEGWTDLDEPDANKVGETEARTGNTGTPDLGAWKINVHEIDAEPRATQKMLDMSIRDVEGWLAQKVGRKFGRKENTAFVNGSRSRRGARIHDVSRGHAGGHGRRLAEDPADRHGRGGRVPRHSAGRRVH